MPREYISALPITIKTDMVPPVITMLSLIVNLGPNIRAKAYTAKEGTTGNILENTIIKAAGMTSENSCRSFVELQGNDAVIRYNDFYRQGNANITSAIKVYDQAGDGKWGYNNDIYTNKFYLDGVCPQLTTGEI